MDSLYSGLTELKFNDFGVAKVTRFFFVVPIKMGMVSIVGLLEKEREEV